MSINKHLLNSKSNFLLYIYVCALDSILRPCTKTIHIFNKTHNKEEPKVEIVNNLLNTVGVHFD